MHRIDKEKEVKGVEKEKAEILSLLEMLNENIIVLQRIEFALLACMRERLRLFVQLKEQPLWSSELEREFCLFRSETASKKSV